jgi:alpha-1,2-mannosyltransferase
MTSRLTRLTAVALVCACLGNVVGEVFRSLRDAYNTDFLSSFYVAGDMLRRGNDAIYCAGCLQSHAEQLFHTGPAIFSFQYDNPALGAWLLQPLTYLTPQAALACFLLLSLIAVGVAAWLLHHQITRDPRRTTIAVLAFASFPAAMTFAYGQWDAVLALAAAGAYVALQRDRQFLAGLLIAVLLFKPQLVWLVPVVVVVAGSWRVLLGIAAGGAVWALSSIAILGWSDSLLWLRQISPNIVARTGLSLPHMLVSFGASSPVVVAASAILAAAATLLLLVSHAKLRSLTGQQQFSLGLLVSMLAAPHLLSYDLIVLAPLIVLWAVDHERHALVAALALSAAFLVDLALPPSWAIVEAAALLGVGAWYCRDLLSSPARRLAHGQVITATTLVHGTGARS